MDWACVNKMSEGYFALRAKGLLHARGSRKEGEYK
jgi:hypothetical protein